MYRYHTDSCLWSSLPWMALSSGISGGQVNERKGTIKFQLNKVLCIGVAMSNLSLWEKQIQLNIEMSINFRFGKMSPRILVWCVGSSMVSPSLAAIVLHSLMSPGREDVAAVLLLDLGRP
ncbi:uncharacterized protein LOC124667915 [Lolium rigidum]|uniref:uncharacterized protein LOC124667915 n=1 Tax=Lolium rigidum TaxID=89674 RepID=UPI001F5E320C|nr:uncharacterized protein LOC124667915 [Lolium rigidum]